MINILMPRLSDTMEEGAIAVWHKKPGDQVNIGDVLVEIETDKATMEYEAYEAGVLHDILVAEGDLATIGAVIAHIDDGTPFPSGPDPASTSTPAVSTDAAPVPPSSAKAQPAPDGDRLFASPLARKVARQNAIDLEHVSGSGPGGRIVRADIEDALTRSDKPAVNSVAPEETPAVNIVATVETPERAYAPAPDGRRSTAVPFDRSRQIISQRLTNSSGSTPHYYVTAVADVENLMVLRAKLNALLNPTGLAKISVNDFLVRASAIALLAHPGVNASFSPEGRGHTLLHQRINIGIAVASEAGLVVPVIGDADHKTPAQIATETKRLVNRAQERKLIDADLADGTFTISNLGMYGIEQFTAIINPPQGAILAVGAARPEPVAVNDTVQIRTRMRYTLSADHRIIDGALAARFLATLTGLLEQPLKILA
jgi:pyruvate dehydrogenase E2 component (dihydrolipoamide acetyltransferase)